ncbi:hypothetical protein K402DRAFT_399123 [Aulographum hederae CBS 113979]|uniref:Uncharacterized protein n=1 Tax=Aulographum hederae CBS 113979 TaxID=1176131 RepID=A0A6G1GJ80_9PEZI|nr:hypothetical protein K402DRAFT_399123 [Aulographum hederae CBS 113979]
MGRCDDVGKKRKVGEEGKWSSYLLAIWQLLSLSKPAAAAGLDNPLRKVVISSRCLHNEQPSQTSIHRLRFTADVPCLRL